MVIGIDLTVAFYITRSFVSLNSPTLCTILPLKSSNDVETGPRKTCSNSVLCQQVSIHVQQTHRNSIRLLLIPHIRSQHCQTDAQPSQFHLLCLYSLNAHFRREETVLAQDRFQLAVTFFFEEGEEAIAGESTFYVEDHEIRQMSDSRVHDECTRRRGF